jgi:hypothetical protein
MPTSMYQQSPITPYMYGPRAPPTRILSPHNPFPRSPAFSRGHGSPTHFMPRPPSPFDPYAAMTPGYIIAPPRKSRKGMSPMHRSSRSHSRAVSASFHTSLTFIILIVSFF